MNRISRCDWLPENSRHYGAVSPARDTGFVPQGKFMFWCFIPYNKSFIDQACSQDGWILARSFFACLFFSPISTQKKNFSNIHPSWPHTWSITHVSFHYSIQRSALLFSRFFSDDQMMGCVDLLKLTWGPPTRTLYWQSLWIFDVFFHFRHLQGTFQNGRPLVVQDFSIPFIFQNNSVPFDPGFVLLLASTYFLLPCACVRAIIARKEKSTSEAEAWH